MALPPAASGKTKVAGELRHLIRRMKKENPSWGAPRIHGELLLLGFDISEPDIHGLHHAVTAQLHASIAQVFGMQRHRRVDAEAVQAYNGLMSMMLRCSTSRNAVP